MSFYTVRPMSADEVGHLEVYANNFIINKPRGVRKADLRPITYLRKRTNYTKCKLESS
jgi:hypothetical protein